MSYLPLESICCLDFPSNVTYLAILVVIAVIIPFSVMCFSYFQIFKTVKHSNTKTNAVHHQQRNIDTKVDLTVQTPSPAETTTDNQGGSEDNSKNILGIQAGFPKLERKQTSKEKEEMRLTLSFLVVLGVFISCLVPNCTYIFLRLFPTLQIPRAFGIIAILLGQVTMVLFWYGR